MNPYNYFNNPRELEAEYAGIKGAYNYLAIIFPQEKAENLIIDYFNSKIGYQYYVAIYKSVKSLNEIDRIFTKSIFVSKSKKRLYNTNYINKDNSVKYMQSINDDFILYVNNINDGILQDKLLAGAYSKYLEDKDIVTELRQSGIYIEKKDSLIGLFDDIIKDNSKQVEVDTQLENI